jgi:predicted PurR-regulated permease PerM
VPGSDDERRAVPPAMSDDEAASRTFLRVLLVVVGVPSALVVLPFLQPILAAGLLAYLVAPLNARLSRRLGPTTGTTVTILLTAVLVLGPLLALLSVAARQAVSVVRGAELPDAAAVESLARRWAGSNPDLSALVELLSGGVQTALRGLVGYAVSLVGGLPALAVGSVVFLFALFYLLRDGDDLVAWLRATAPLPPAATDELLSRTDDLLWAAVVGNVVVAGVQAVLTVLGFLVLGFDDLVFWGVLTFALSLLPLIGASIVWIPAVAYLVLVGEVPGAVGLLVYGTFVISGSDNLVRPMAMKRGANLNPGLLVVGIFGGVAVFGFVGLFVGPVLVGLTVAVVELLAEERTATAES